MATDYYYILTFHSTADVIQCEKHLKSHCRCAVMPIPRELSDSCGLAIRLLLSVEEDVLSICQSLPVSASLYRYYLKRQDGKHPVVPIKL
ncbi:MAG: DUF3343 domain-containing protein [Lachnospiraceae bacterium]|nr:DUF3343 domain-containing protein [Lachnospiraceae bacterium]